MPASYKVDRENRWVHTMIWGVVSPDDLLSILKRSLTDVEVDPGFAEIVDLTEVIKVDFSADVIRELAETSVFSQHSRRAIVVPDNTQVFGMARMYEGLREMRGETGIRLFRTLDEALDWVAPKRAGA